MTESFNHITDPIIREITKQAMAGYNKVAEVKEWETRNFSKEELRCPCYVCAKLEPHKCDIDALTSLQRIRDMVGFPIYLESAYHCKAHPSEAKKQEPGEHYKGTAFNISISWGSKRSAILHAAFHNGVRGVGIADTFITLDWRAGSKTCWGYK